uniref:N-acyl phosphatidylethanolamine phospholipase D n=1 Tax=Poecilia latipinna TaxID=48699 RepID=A0A3B3U8B6_9TELE
TPAHTPLFLLILRRLSCKCGRAQALIQARHSVPDLGILVFKIIYIYIFLVSLFLLSSLFSPQVLDSELPRWTPAGMRVTWLGHATVLVNILTDPIFSQRASFLQFMGPKRYSGPPCTVEQLPRTDAVLISHSHYDNLDAGSVASLNARFGGELHWYVPTFLNEEDRLNKKGKSSLSLHENLSLIFCCTKTVRISLWSSWSVLGPNHRFFFAGDTGYCSSYQIGRRFGPFNLGAIPIGANLPRDVMKGQHVDPEEAYYLEPPVRLREALEQKGLKPESFFTLHHRASRIIVAQDVFD